MLRNLRAVGRAGVDLVVAEIRALIEDLEKTRRGLVRGLVVLGFAAALGFWTLGLLIYLGVEALALVVSRFEAVAIVAGVFVLATALVVARGAGILKRLESPGETIRRRWSQHVEWWEARIAEEDEGADGADRAGRNDVDEPAGGTRRKERK